MSNDIDFKNLDKLFGGKKRDSANLVLVGPSCSGKTSLLIRLAEMLTEVQQEMHGKKMPCECRVLEPHYNYLEKVSKIADPWETHTVDFIRISPPVSKSITWWSLSGQIEQPTMKNFLKEYFGELDTVTVVLEFNLRADREYSKKEYFSKLPKANAYLLREKTLNKVRGRMKGILNKAKGVSLVYNKIDKFWEITGMKPDNNAKEQALHLAEESINEADDIFSSLFNTKEVGEIQGPYLTYADKKVRGSKYLKEYYLHTMEALFRPVKDTLEKSHLGRRILQHFQEMKGSTRN